MAIALGTDYTAPGMDYEKNYVQKTFARQGYGHYLDSIGFNPHAIEQPSQQKPLFTAVCATPQENRKQAMIEPNPQPPITINSLPKKDYHLGLG